MDEPIFGKLVTTVDVFIYLTLFTNLLCTGLISYKIFTVRRNVSGAMSSRSDGGVTSRIITIIVESAAVYTLLLVAQLIANNLDSYTPPTIGLVFSLPYHPCGSTETISSSAGMRSEVQVRLERVTIQHHDVETTSKDEETASNKYGNSSVV
ncbi:hypothetical protein DFH08DRAFT_964846 [Mycena albidolilacea]|uniref:Uncharacterized protein n=1 Tax=Mycena albidolilacea TaxID=1033008 RepID=A0AAD6ZSC9_9AGAR|nr:hypothetical protein DFH08DRAFT_964846 [Mycena albidolilacea]